MLCPRFVTFSYLWLLLPSPSALHAEDGTRPTAADKPAAVRPTDIVGSVFGKSVTAADIGLTAPIDKTVRFDARDKAQWELMGRIMKAFGTPVYDRFVEQQKIEATADEITSFSLAMRKSRARMVSDTEAQLAKVKADLAKPELSNEDKAKLQKEQTTIERSLGSLRNTALLKMQEDKAHESIGEKLIVKWKTEQAMQRVYGGRVIFQQFGPEALDARRRLFEEAENNGDLKFDDAGVRHMFYYYSNMPHTKTDEKILEKPWWSLERKD